jgi:hypothetical protein
MALAYEYRIEQCLRYGYGLRVGRPPGAEWVGCAPQQPESWTAAPPRP